MARVKHGEVRLYRFQAPDKQRPVVILTRQSAIGYLHSVTVAPVTSTIRGIPTEVRLDVEDGMRGPCVVSLDTVTTVAQRHLGRRVTQLSSARMTQVCEALAFALGCRS